MSQLQQVFLQEKTVLRNTKQNVALIEDKTKAEDLPSIVNSFVSSLLRSSILLSTEQEAEQVNNETSDQITENIHIQND